jgi:PTH1 family peptidyl-tRNA hydrolase
MICEGGEWQFSEVFLIAGLGNPTRAYRKSRHNIGFTVVERFGRDLGVKIKKRRFKSRIAWTKMEGQEVLLVRPHTFMNRSGKAIKAFVDLYGFEIERVMVVHDDLDLPVGRIKIVKQGGTGGHKGALSIVEYLGSKDFPRIKIGIGRPLRGENIEDYVLGPFYDEQAEIIDVVIGAAAAACGLFVKEGVESAMNKVNRKNFLEKEESN